MSNKKGINTTIRKKINLPKANIQELQESRDGGQIALRGFTYQCLYSCYLILSQMDNKTIFYLEGVEDIDRIKYSNKGNSTTHIQLKYSTQKQDASFLKDVLKNFLEAYLIDKHRNFKLVYDFPVANGHLSKLINREKDKKTTIYWKGVIEQIKAENSYWDWRNFSFEDFFSKLSFEKKDKNTLVNDIEVELIKKYNITTDNIIIFANSIKYCCLEKMTQRSEINKSELDKLIQLVKDNISKGVINPAFSWIKKIDFMSITSVVTDLSYYEGKKATPQDIIQNLPVRRQQLECELVNSIHKNTVTVIKASSGQGKTTLALQGCFALQSEYVIYQLRWCEDAKELDNIVQFFKTRVKLGEKPLILLDNLDSQLSQWNRLAQLLQEDIIYHYKLLITTREDDWYNYSNDLSNIKSLHIVKLTLREKDAEKIFKALQNSQKIHPSVSNWKKAWSKVADKKLLIEYVYLLTHGEMLSERISHQISQIGTSTLGNIKCEILRLVCFADICGTRLPLKSLISNLTTKTSYNLGEIFKSIENEFLISINIEEKYIEGLHPVRSKHIVDSLHEFYEINDTALQVLRISDRTYLSKLFSYLPQFITSKKSFYSRVIDTFWNSDDMEIYVQALQGLFSGSVMQYYYEHKTIFDDANEHGGLFLLSNELNPFTKVNEFDVSLNTLDSIRKMFPDDQNLQYLNKLRDTTPKHSFIETDIYIFGKMLYTKLNENILFETINDIFSYSKLADWLYNIDKKFNLSKNILLSRLWNEKQQLPLDVIALLMYTCFCGNNEEYMAFVKENLQSILQYLKVNTESLKVYLSDDRKEIHIEYILLLSNLKKANEESVSRLNKVCRMLPIFKMYCADAIKPTINIISNYKITDESHKTMPIENIVTIFHQEFNSLWNKTLMSNYECDTISEWLEHWFSIRSDIIKLFDKISICIYQLLEGRKLDNLATEVDCLRNSIYKELIREVKFPHEDRPFEQKITPSKNFNEVKKKFFISIRNFCNLLPQFLIKESEQSRLALMNLKIAYIALTPMQIYFAEISKKHDTFLKKHDELCKLEKLTFEQVMTAYLYFEEHTPNKYFNKYDIKIWYNKQYANQIKSGQLALEPLSSNFKVTFPERYYQQDALSYYPIILHDIDTTSIDKIIEPIFNCKEFAETKFHYLIIANCDNKGYIMPNGLSIPKDFFNNLKYLNKTKDKLLSEEIELSYPFSIDITTQILDCFDSKYEIRPLELTGYEGIDKVMELLWAYSKIQEFLIEECDIEYRKFLTDKLNGEINSTIASFREKILPEDFKALQNLWKNVLHGETFSDEYLNEFYENLILN